MLINGTPLSLRANRRADNSMNTKKILVLKALVLKYENAKILLMFAELSALLSTVCFVLRTKGALNTNSVHRFNVVPLHSSGTIAIELLNLRLVYRLLLVWLVFPLNFKEL